jgi:6-phosphofructokinase
MSGLKKIAVLTSGGDAPGMNAAVRAVTRGALAKGWEVFGVRNGFAGLVSGVLERLAARDVGGIIQHGGTVLGSARSPDFRKPTAARGRWRTSPRAASTRWSSSAAMAPRPARRRSRAKASQWSA